MQHNENDVVCARSFELEKGSELRLCIFKPMLDSPGSSRFKCRFKIVGPSIDIDCAAYGLDSLHSLMTAIRMARSDIKAFKDASAEVLSWMGDSEDLGLNV